jgi:hypothetical protein
VRDDTNEAFDWPADSSVDSTVLDAENPLPMMEPADVILVDEPAPVRKVMWTERSPRERADAISRPKIIVGRVIDLGMPRPLRALGACLTRKGRPERRAGGERGEPAPSAIGGAMRVLIRFAAMVTLVLAGVVIGMHMGTSSRLLIWLLEVAQ